MKLPPGFIYNDNGVAGYWSPYTYNPTGGSPLPIPSFIPVPASGIMNMWAE